MKPAKYSTSSYSQARQNPVQVVQDWDWQFAKRL